MHKYQDYMLHVYKKDNRFKTGERFEAAYTYEKMESKFMQACMNYAICATRFTFARTAGFCGWRSWTVDFIS